MSLTSVRSVFILTIASVLTIHPSHAENDIRKLSQHFIDPGGDISPWMVVPKENVKSYSTDEHTGMLTIWPGEQGKDIKGILQDPIKIDDYPLPWQFHLGFVQNMSVIKGGEGQNNTAFGLNLAVTFSDPSTWPEDRTQMPPETHSLQVFVVHLGNFGENYRTGVPLLKKSDLNMGCPSPEAFMIYGRGDLHPHVTGNWDVRNTWMGQETGNISGAGPVGGAASDVLRFKVGMEGTSNLTIGFGYGLHPGWRTRNINTSQFGNITGIWEIGPIISMDRWIPDVLAAELGIDEPPAWVPGLLARYKTVWAEGDVNTLEPLKTLFEIDPPNTKYQYYVDYAVFHGNGPHNVEHLSEDYDIPGYLADQKYSIEGNGFCETFSNPGYMTLTLLGTNGGWAMCPKYGGSGIDLVNLNKPPFEIEIAVITPDNAQPWNLFWNVGIGNEAGDLYAGWMPGIKNIPGVGCKYSNSFITSPTEWEYPTEVQNSAVNPKFDPEIPELLGHKPLYWMLQVVDDYRVRVGVRGDKNDPWTFSTECNTKDLFGSDGGLSIVNKNATGAPAHTQYNADEPFGKIGKFGFPALVSFQGSGSGPGWGPGNYPGYQKFLFDYVHYRFELSE